MITYSDLCICYEKLEKNPSMLRKKNILCNLLSSAQGKERANLCYLLQASTKAAFQEDIYGISTKTLKSLFFNLYGEEPVEKYMRRLGDLGSVASELSIPLAAQNRTYSINEMITFLHNIQKFSGKNSMKEKERYVCSILSTLSPLEAKWFVRILLRKLRTGASNKLLLRTLSDIHSIKYSELFPRYAQFPDIGKISKYLEEDNLADSKLTPLIPYMPMMAERCKGDEELQKRIIFPAWIQEKYDGIRMQVHKKENEVKIFTRNLLDITDSFPEIVQECTYLKGDFILDGECLSEKGFSSVSSRRRKYNIEKESKKTPVILRVFDCVYYNTSLLDSTIEERVQKIKNIVKNSKIITAAPLVEVDFNLYKSEFKKSIQKGLEGVMVKKRNSIYTPGKRSFDWIKIKKEYFPNIIDTVDLVIIGGYQGKGNRVKWDYGSFLLGCMTDVGIIPISKIGTGFSEADLTEINSLLKEYKVNSPYYLKSSEGYSDVDCWFDPKIIIEVFCSELSKKKNARTGNVDFSLRFPVYSKKIRFDKSIPTTLEEIQEIYQ